MAKRMSDKRFGKNHWSALHELIQRESGWQVGRVNHSSYACGLGQSLKCAKTYGKMPATKWIVDKYGQKKLFLANPNYKKEVNFLISYIEGRYGNPSNALAFHNAHNYY